MKKKKHLKFLSLLLVLSFLMNPVAMSEAKSKVKLNVTNETVCIGESITLKVKNASSTPKWSSSRKSVASVSSKGKVTAKKAGTAKITAQIGKSKYACKITVPKQYISKTSLTLDVGENKEINIYGISDKDNIVWKSSNKKIAIVSSDGIITGMKAGTVIISGTANNGKGKTYECKVIVVSDIIPTPKPTVNPTPNPIVTNQPIITKTPMPITTATPVPITPTAAPEFTSTPRPDSTSKPQVTNSPIISPKPDIPVNTIESNYSRFAEYLTTYGKRLSDGRYCIAGIDKNMVSGMTLNYSFAYDPINNIYEFVCLTNDNVVRSDSASIMTLSPKLINNAKIRFLNADKDNFACDGSVYIDISKYVDNQNLTFAYNWGDNMAGLEGNWIIAEFEKNFNKIGTAHYALSVYYWDIKVKQLNLGLTMKDLGFTSY